MKSLTDTATANSKGVGHAHLRRWRLLFLMPLLLLAFACGGGGGGESGETGQATGTPQPTNTALPGNLAGEWKTILTYVPAYYTGIVPTSTTDFLGTLGVFLYLQPNGAYQFDLRTAANYFGGNCFRTTHWSETGSVSVTDASITFTSTHASNVVMDSCGQAQFVDPAPTGTATYPMTREQDQTGWPILRLRMPTGEDLVLEKCRDCG